MKNFKLLFLVLTITMITAGIIAGCGGGGGIFGSNTPTDVPESGKEFIVNGPVPNMSNGGGQIVFAPSLQTDGSDDFNANYEMIVTNLKDQSLLAPVSITGNIFTFKLKISDADVVPNIQVKRKNTTMPLLSLVPGRVPKYSEVPPAVKQIVVNGVSIDSASTARALIAKQNNLTPKVPIVTVDGADSTKETVIFTPGGETENCKSKNTESENKITVFEKLIQNSVDPSTINEVAKAVQTVNTVFLSDVSQGVKDNISRIIESGGQKPTASIISAFVTTLNNPDAHNIIIQKQLPLKIEIGGTEINSQTSNITEITANNVTISGGNIKPQVDFSTFSPSVVKPGDTVNLYIRTDKPLGMVPNVKIFGRPAFMNRISEDSYNASMKITATDSGVVSFSITGLYDKNGNSNDDIITEIKGGSGARVERSINVPLPVFNIPSGIYTNDQTIEITTASTCEIRYEMVENTGTDIGVKFPANPTVASQSYTSEILVRAISGQTAEKFIKAISVSKETGAVSDIAVACYKRLVPPVQKSKAPAPKFVNAATDEKLISGTYYNGITLKISSAENTSFYISESLTGLKSEANKYTQEITVNTVGATKTFYAMAVRNDGLLLDSDIACITVKIINKKLTGNITAAPGAGSYNAAAEVKLSYARGDGEDNLDTTAVKFIYTLDGTIPSQSNGKICRSTDIIKIYNDAALKVIAIHPEYAYSDFKSFDYRVSISGMEKVKMPVISPIDGSTFENQLIVTMECSTENALIYFSLSQSDGDFNLSSWKRYYRPITITMTATLRALAVKEGMQNSDLVSMSYKNVKYVSTPAVMIAGTEMTSETRLFDATTAVELACGTQNAIIYYTLDGSEPDDSANNKRMIYNLSSPISIFKNTILKTCSVLNDIKSGVVRKEYRVRAPKPIIEPAHGSFTGGGTVRITSPLGNTGKILYYTEPAGNLKAPSYRPRQAQFDISKAKEYTGDITIDSNAVLLAVAYNNEYTYSEPASGYYDVFAVAPAADISDTAEVYDIGRKVTLATATPGADIYYNIRPVGDEDETFNYNEGVKLAYTAPVTLNKNTKLLAIAVKDNLNHSEIMIKKYRVKLPAPSFGHQQSPYAATLECAIVPAGLKIMIAKSLDNYASFSEYNGPDPIAATLTLKAYATVDKDNTNQDGREYENSVTITSSEYIKPAALNEANINFIANSNKFGLKGVTADMQYSLDGTDRETGGTWADGTGADIDLSQAGGGKYIVVRDKNHTWFVRGMGRIYSPLTNGFTGSNEPNRWAVNFAENSIRFTSLSDGADRLNSSGYIAYVSVGTTAANGNIINNTGGGVGASALNAPNYFKLSDYIINSDIQAGSFGEATMKKADHEPWTEADYVSVALKHDGGNGSAGVNSKDDIYFNMSQAYKAEATAVKASAGEFINFTAAPALLTTTAARSGDKMWVSFSEFNNIYHWYKDAVTLTGGRAANAPITGDNMTANNGYYIYISENPGNGTIKIPAAFGNVTAPVSNIVIDNSVQKKMTINWTEPAVTTNLKYKIYCAMAANEADVDTSAKIKTIANAGGTTGKIIELNAPASNSGQFDITENYYLNCVVEVINTVSGNISRETAGTAKQEKQIDIYAVTVEKSATSNKLVLKNVTAGIEYSIDGTAGMTGGTWTEGSGSENAPDIDLSAMTSGKFIVVKNKKNPSEIRGLGKVIAAPLNAAMGAYVDNRWALLASENKVELTHITDMPADMNCYVYYGADAGVTSLAGNTTIANPQTGSSTTHQAALSKTTWGPGEFVSMYLKSNNNTANDSSDDIYTQLTATIRPLPAPVNGAPDTVGNFVIDGTAGTITYDNSDNSRTDFKLT
ncbi:MAG: chitobiase/beta-hexosaminidase C-terminal domain-containing protein [Candidatus Wallbacteria bacterium]